MLQDLEYCVAEFNRPAAMEEFLNSEKSGLPWTVDRILTTPFAGIAYTVILVRDRQYMSPAEQAAHPRKEVNINESRR